jgi:large subunit ribosomal protein L16
VHDEQPEAIRR